MESLDLLTEIDLQHVDNINLILASSKMATTPSTSTTSKSSLTTKGKCLYDQNYLQQCLRLALATENIEIIQLLFQYFPNFSPTFLSTIFLEYASDGTLPHIIYLLQNMLSPKELAYHYRQRIKFRTNGFIAYYVVDPMEPLQLNELKQQLIKSDSKKDSYLTYLRKVRTMNDFFIDAALGDRRYALHQILSSKEFTTPNITAINEAFVAVCRRRNFVLTIMLSKYISQEAFDEAFFLAIDESDSETVDWLLNGRLGFHPSQERLESEYRKIKMSDMNQQPTIFRMGRVLRPQHVPHRTYFPIIESRVSEEVRRAVDDEIRAIRRAQERRNRQRQMFHIQEADIHSYSAATIDDNPEPLNDTEAQREQREIGNRENAAEDVENRNNIDNRNRNGIGNGNEMGGGDDDDDDDNPLDDVLEFLRPPGRGRNGKLSLNEAVIAHITRRISRLPSYDVERTMGELVTLIRRYIPPTQQDDAVRLLGDILNTRSAKLFATTLEFLYSYPSSSSSGNVIETWVQGFLSESVVMHSCNPGALERVVTGLRGINDPQLDKIFAQAEAPQLINIFLKSTFNIFYDEHHPETKVKAIQNAQHIASEIIQRGGNESSSLPEIQEKLLEYAHGVVMTYDSNIDKYKEEILVIIEIVMDNYETHLRDHIINMLNQKSDEMNVTLTSSSSSTPGQR